MINDIQDNKSFRSINNSELVSLKNKSEREVDLKSENEPSKRRRKNNSSISNLPNLNKNIDSSQFSIKKEDKNSEDNEDDKISIKKYKPYNKNMNIIPEDIREFQQKKECTYYQYGNYPVYQKVYFCDNCDTNSTEKICENCYYQCHESCGNDIDRDDNGNTTGIPNNLFINYDEEENLKFMHGKYLTFICSCGLKRHQLKQVNDETGTLQCNFLNLDTKLKNKCLYSCLSCKVQILCFICYVKCHKNCKTKKLLTEDPNINRNKSCGCCFKNNHSNRFILNKFVSFIFYKRNNYDTIPYVLKIQLLNCIYDSDIYKLLYSKINLFMTQALEQNKRNIKKTSF